MKVINKAHVFIDKVCYEMVRKKIDTSRSKQRVMEINPSE